MGKKFEIVEQLARKDLIIVSSLPTLVTAIEVCVSLPRRTKSTPDHQDHCAGAPGFRLR